jgi:hypothetical protein
MAISLDESRALDVSLKLFTNILSKVTFSLSKNELWIDPMTLANRSMSSGAFSMQSVKSSEIYSDSMLSPVIRFLFMRSIELVKHFLKMYWSSWMI